MMNVIYLAAGFSRRFGENKLLYQLNDKPIYRHALDRLFLLQKKMDVIQDIVVVTQYDEIERYVESQTGIQVVRNAHSEQGISSSLQLGLRASDADAYLCCVADQPYLTETTLQTFIEAYVQDGRGIGCIANGGKFGNPVIFSSKYKEELLALSGDKGGKQIINRHMEDVMLYEVANQHELQDIDMPLSFIRL
ncbi:MAG: nucleotidyltransferase family protein [bacterium]|nr:nucleotidyltransferase family protein [bacterium]